MCGTAFSSKYGILFFIRQINSVFIHPEGQNSSRECVCLLILEHCDDEKKLLLFQCNKLKFRNFSLSTYFFCGMN